MVLVSSIWDLRVICKTNVSQLHEWWLDRSKGGNQLVRIPDVHEAVAGATGGKDILLRVPLGEENASFVLVDYLDAVIVRLKRNFVQSEM